MEIFYICVILVGIFIVCFALIWMVIEKKNARDYRLDLDERKHELQQVIEDAEQLLIELNNFSGYIVDRLEEKQKYLEELLMKVDGKTGSADSYESRKPDKKSAESIATEKKNNDFIPDKDYMSLLSEKKGKLISLDDRKREVIKLSRNGISSTEIARLLNIGKGEIELISRMCK